MLRSTKYGNDPRVKPYGANGYAVTVEDIEYRVLHTDAFNWVICVGDNNEFLQVPGAGENVDFATGIPTADEAIEALLMGTIQ